MMNPKRTVGDSVKAIGPQYYWISAVGLLIGIINAIAISVAKPITANDPFQCEASYTELVAELQSDTNGGNQVSPYESGLLRKVKAVLSQCPDHVGLLILMANYQVSQGHNEDALAYATEALQIDPANAQAMHTKGMILSLFGKAEESLKLINRSVEIEPENVIFLTSYCSSLEEFGRYAEAVEVCSRAVQTGNAPPAAYYIRGRSYEAIGQTDNAHRDYVEARELGFDMWPKKGDLP